MYVTSPTTPQSFGVGVTARGISAKHDTGADWVAEMDVLMPWATEITLAEYDQMVAANKAHNDAIQPPAPQPRVRPETTARDALRSATTVAQIKSALDDYFAARGG